MSGKCGEGCGRYDVVRHVDSCFLQMFLEDRFSTTPLLLMEFSRRLKRDKAL